MTSVLVTGADGFVGQAVCKYLSESCPVRGVVRTLGRPGQNIHNVEYTPVGGIGPTTRWGGVLDGVDAIVHLAGRAHRVNDSSPDVRAQYLATNVEGTLGLARAAVQAGVKRFVYVSSSKVNGDVTKPGQPFRESDSPEPQDIYAESKWRSEIELRALSDQLGITILRPPLVFGPNVKANFLALIRLVDKGWPLPFGGVDNRRSLIYVENLARVISACLQSTAAIGKTYLVADEALSLPGLIRALSEGLGRKARLFPVPGGFLSALGVLTGRRGVMERLTSSMELDDSAIRRDLAWAPPISMDEGIRRTCDWYRASVASR